MTTITQERNALAAVGMRHRRRNEWNARRSYTDPRTVIEPATRVFIHITVTNPGAYNSDDAHARAIESIGISRFPNTGISYNRGIMHSGGRVYEFQPVGRRGAHTVNNFGISSCTRSGSHPGSGSSLTAPSGNLNYNSRAYVICQNVGHTVTNGMIDQIGRAVAADHLAGFVTSGAAHNIHGHRCVSAKSCPGDRMWARMDDAHDAIDHYIANGLDGSGAGAVGYDGVWRVDNRMVAPPLWAAPDNPQWWPENVMERLGVAVSELRDGTFETPGDPADRKFLSTFIRYHYASSADGKAAVNDTVIPLVDVLAAKADALAAGQADAAAKLDQIAALLGQHAAGVLDEHAVVDGARALVHDGTATG